MVWAFDIEIYPNFFLAGFKNRSTGEIVRFEKRPGEPLDHKGLERFLRKNTTVGFNSIGFDLPLTWMAINGYSLSALKKAADAIIVGGKKHWQLMRDVGLKIPQLDHIDLMEVVPGQYSLKLYGGRMHMPKMQDLPYDPNSELDDDQVEELRVYWENDLDTTLALYDRFEKEIELRSHMGNVYKTDLRSKSDAQVAEAAIKRAIGQITGITPERPHIPPGTVYRYNFPDFISFYSDELLDLADVVGKAKFHVNEGSGAMEMPPELADLEIKIGSSVYRLGIGGLHSSEHGVCHIADDTTVLRDADVASYYPFLILIQKLFPKHLGKAFLKIYKGFVDERLVAKRAGDKRKSNSLKIVVNGSFGKLGSKWSCLYSPDLMIQVTITGQLALLMLIERLERVGIRVISANTDGVVAKFNKDQEELYERVCAKWQAETGFELEYTDYSAIYSRDVNSYLAFKRDGEVKRKGAYAVSEAVGSGWPAPSNEICTTAVVAFLRDGIPLERTIRECTDIRQFVSIRRVNGGAVDADGTPLGKAVRWYYAKGVEGGLRYATNGNLVPDTEGARSCMELPDKLPGDIDYDWYVNKCKRMLLDIGWGSRGPVEAPVEKPKRGFRLYFYCPTLDTHIVEKPGVRDFDPALFVPITKQQFLQQYRPESHNPVDLRTFAALISTIC